MSWRGKAVMTAIVIFGGWFIYTDPHGAAAAVTNLLGVLQSVGNSLSVFFTSL